jgi:tRNA (uracil-5-)-methyltransferase TRM9
MHSAVTEKLIEINRTFYKDYAGAFAATRRRIQPGIRRILAELAGQGGCYLDLGCGSGAVAEAWATSGMHGLYLGLDFSEELLAEARRSVGDLDHPGLEIQFAQADLTRPDWVSEVPAEKPLDGILAFAVIHHIPGAVNRQRLAEQVRSLARQNSLFILSVWQFQNSPKWATRCLPWESAGIDPSELEEGDTLLDWRHVLPGQAQQPGLRYVHQFSSPELRGLASRAGFRVLNEFESDGQGGRLGLYQTWLAE